MQAHAGRSVALLEYTLDSEVQSPKVLGPKTRSELQTLNFGTLILAFS